MRKIFGIIVIGIVILFFAQTVEASTYYVSTTGNDSNPGTISAPFRTIAKGFSALSPGGTLYIRGGTYVETPVTPPSGISWNSPVTISRFGSETVVFGTPNPLNTFNTSLRYLVVDGIIFDGINGSGDVIAIGQGPTHLRFENCEIKNGYHNGILTSDPSSFSPTDTYLEFINCKVHDNGRQSLSEYSSGHNGVYITTGQNLIDGGEFYNNQRAGIRFFTSVGGVAGNNNVARNTSVHDNGWNAPSGAGFYVGDNNQKIYNNLVYHNNGHGIDVEFKNPVSPLIANNTTYNNNGDGTFLSSTVSGAVIKNNISYLNSINNQGSGTIISNNFTSDPKFVNASVNDYHLQSTSPAINYGVVLSEFTMDKDGNTRVGNYDAGAYEYVSGTPTSLLGDINNDRIVNSLDWSLMSAKWLTSDTNADLNKDGAVNSLDWSVMSGNWLKTI